jgi:hypothetical protein
MDDGSGRVDWERLEAVLIVLGSNIKHKHLLTSRSFRNSWATPFVGSWPRSYMHLPRLRMAPLDYEDPYNVAGTWLRVSIPPLAWVSNSHLFSIADCLFPGL